MDRQRMPVPAVRDDGTVRRGRSVGGAVSAHPRFTTGGQEQAFSGDPRYPGNRNDSGIVRDRTAWYPTDSRHGVGTGVVDWTAAGPPRPDLHIRNVTVRTMAGTSRTRALASPVDPTIGLHSKTVVTPRGNIARYGSGAQQMRPPRRDRLSPARYTGQSYSATTKVQGAK